MDAPHGKRGLYYTTHLDMRCPSYKGCNRCQQCSNFNRHLAMCRDCESNKSFNKHCECLHHQRAAIVQLESRMGRPAFVPDMEPGTVHVATSAFDPEMQSAVDALDLHATEID